MSIQNISEALPYTQAPQASPCAGASGPAFRELLDQHQPPAAESEAAAASSGHSEFVKEDLVSALYQARLTMLERMKLGKEKQDEEEAWEHLMEQVDTWIESLRGEGSIERSARAYAAVKTDEADRVRPRRQPADAILDMLTAQLQGK